MSLVLSGSTSGSVTLQEPAIAGTTVLDLPATSGNVVVDSATQTLTNKSIAATQLTGTIAAARLPTGSVLQVVQTTMTTTASVSGSAWNEITALATSITPTSASSRILIMPSIDYSASNGYRTGLRLVRNSTEILLGDSAGTRTRASQVGRFFDSANQMVQQGNRIYLDSPATTSATTYRFYLSAETDAGATLYVNRTVSDADGATHFRGTSTVVLMEIAS
jgi:hypothetical protein